jgi:hypothetical protein
MPALNETALRDEICRLGVSLFARGLSFGSAGNISARLDDGWLMTPTNVSLGRHPGPFYEAAPGFFLWVINTTMLHTYSDPALPIGRVFLARAVKAAYELDALKPNLNVMQVLVQET